jgi:segregation and condensation protein A
MSIRVQLQQFEGPLDLLLYLIRKEEMDIFNINIVEITHQYLEFIKLMKEFDLEVAGEFVAMAATLIHIKSKMLLPQYNENGEIVEDVDPRKALVQKLLEYEKFKEAAKSLYDRPLLNRDLWARGIREKIEVADDDIELEENALFSLIGSYRKALKTLNKRIHKVNIKLQSIASRILEMKDQLIVGKQVIMRELFNQTILDVKEKSRNMLITFLSLLELGKMEFVSLYQTETYGDIYVTTKQPITEDVVSRAENYDNLNSDQIAAQMIQKTQMDQQRSQILSMDESESVEDSLMSAVQTESANDQAQLDFITEDDMFAHDGATEIATDEEIFAAEIEADLDLKLNPQTEGQV